MSAKLIWNTPVPSYKCPSCNQIITSDFCSNCSIKTLPINPSGDVKPGLTSGLVGNIPSILSKIISPIIITPARNLVDPLAEETGYKPTEKPTDPFPPPKNINTSANAQISLLNGEERLQQCVDAGYALFLIAGVSNSGKTQVIKSFYEIDQHGFAFNFDSLTRVEPSPPGHIRIYPVQQHLAGCKAAVVDTAGEYFTRLYNSTELDEKSLRPLKRLAKSLSGIIFIVDLRALWGPYDPGRSEYARQLDIVNWVLLLLRWLRFGKVPILDNSASLSRDDIKFAVASLGKKKLDIPVLVLFSKADELLGITIPEQIPACPGRRLGYPARESPLFLTRCCLGSLYRGIVNHAKFFHFDFCNAINTDEDTGIIIDGPACGISLSLRWLLHKHWRLYWNVPTNWWINWQWMLDFMLKRSARWNRLEHPGKFR